MAPFRDNCDSCGPGFNLADFDATACGECTDFTALKACIGERTFCTDLSDLMKMSVPYDAKLDMLVQWVKYLKSVIAMYVCEFTKEINEIKRRLDIIEAEIVKIKNRLDIIESRLDAIDQQIINLWNAINNLQQQINNLDQRVTNLEISSVDYEQRISYLETMMSRIIQNLINSGAWNQTTNNFNSGRNIATGNINLFGGTQDGSSFIRTNNGSTANDITAGIS